MPLNIDYTKIPEHCREGMRLYVEEGVIPGGFLQAVICNDLVNAIGKADQQNLARIFDYAEFLYNELPINAWGSKRKMEEWSTKQKGGSDNGKDRNGYVFTGGQ